MGWAFFKTRIFLNPQSRIYTEPKCSMTYCSERCLQLSSCMYIMSYTAGDIAPVQPSVSKEQLAEKCRETREKVISELYSTETDYCACLELCLKTFFASPSPQASALSAEDMETLFGHVEDVMTLSRRLIDQLGTEAIGRPFDQQVVGEFC